MMFIVVIIIVILTITICTSIAVVLKKEFQQDFIELYVIQT